MRRLSSYSRGLFPIHAGLLHGLGAAEKTLSKPPPLFLMSFSSSSFCDNSAHATAPTVEDHHTDIAATNAGTRSGCEAAADENRRLFEMVQWFTDPKNFAQCRRPSYGVMDEFLLGQRFPAESTTDASPVKPRLLVDGVLHEIVSPWFSGEAHCIQRNPLVNDNTLSGTTDEDDREDKSNQQLPSQAQILLSGGAPKERRAQLRKMSFKELRALKQVQREHQSLKLSLDESTGRTDSSGETPSSPGDVKTLGQGPRVGGLQETAPAIAVRPPWMLDAVVVIGGYEASDFERTIFQTVCLSMPAPLRVTKDQDPNGFTAASPGGKGAKKKKSGNLAEPVQWKIQLQMRRGGFSHTTHMMYDCYTIGVQETDDLTEETDIRPEVRYTAAALSSARLRSSDDIGEASTDPTAPFGSSPSLAEAPRTHLFYVGFAASEVQHDINIERRSATREGLRPAFGFSLALLEGYLGAVFQSAASRLLATMNTLFEEDCQPPLVFWYALMYRRAQQVYAEERMTGSNAAAVVPRRFLMQWTANRKREEVGDAPSCPDGEEESASSEVSADKMLTAHALEDLLVALLLPPSPSASNDDHREPAKRPATTTTASTDGTGSRCWWTNPFLPCERFDTLDCIQKLQAQLHQRLSPPPRGELLCNKMNSDDGFEEALRHWVRTSALPGLLSTTENSMDHDLTVPPLSPLYPAVNPLPAQTMLKQLHWNEAS